MTQTLQHRPKPHRNRSVGRQPAQLARKRRLSRPYAVFLLAMTYGSTIALLVVAVGFTTLVRNGTAVTEEALQLQRAGASGGGHGHGGGHGGGSQPNIRIEARHVGNLVLDIKAEISMNQDRDPLIKAKVVAFTDMVQMRGVHTQGPLPLQAVPGNPGMYETTANLSMPGDYEVRIEVKDPVQGRKTTTVAVDTTSYGIDAPERKAQQAQKEKGREP